MRAVRGGAASGGAARSILFLEHSRVLMGGQVSCLNIARIMLDRGRRVTLLYPFGGSTEAMARRIAPGARHLHGPNVALNDRRKSLRDVVRMLGHLAGALPRRGLLAGHEVIYVSSVRWAIQAFALAHLMRRRFVYHVRVTPSRLEARLILAFARSKRTHRVVVNTEFVAREMLAMQPALKDCPKFGLLRTPVFPPFAGMAFEDRIGASDPAAPLVCAVLGRLIPSKGQDALLEAAAKTPGVRYVVIGAPHPDFPDYLAALRDRAPANVTLHGESRDVPATLREIGAQLSLVPSRWDEPFGLVAVESVACSCLTVARARGGLADVAANLDLPVFDADADLAAVMNRLAALPRAELAAMAAAQHAALQRHYSLAVFADEVDAICFGPEAAPPPRPASLFG